VGQELEEQPPLRRERGEHGRQLGAAERFAVSSRSRSSPAGAAGMRTPWIGLERTSPSSTAVANSAESVALSFLRAEVVAPPLAKIAEQLPHVGGLYLG
jgi:hypothetical protein